MSLELIIRICGIAGILASLGCVIADIISYGKRDPIITGPGSGMLSQATRMVGFPFWRVNVGNVLGVCMIPITTLGFIPLFYALKPSGLIIALITTGLLIYSYSIVPAFHTSFAYNGSVHRVRNGLDDDSPEARALDSVIEEHKKIAIAPAAVVFFIGFMVYIIYSILAFTGNTYLPRWMGFINPILIGVTISTSHRWVPSAIAGYLVPTGSSASVIPLQILTLIYMWNTV